MLLELCVVSLRTETALSLATETYIASMQLSWKEHYVWMYIYIYTHTYTYIHIDISIYICIDLEREIYIYICLESVAMMPARLCEAITC
jgi:hypothetical protein